MYYAKFHGQGPFGRNLAALGLAEINIRAQLPQASLPGIRTDSWSAGYQASSFELSLGRELNRIKQDERQLRQNMALNQYVSPQKKLEFEKQYLSITQAKKVAALMVEHLQKSMQNIVANFR